LGVSGKTVDLDVSNFPKPVPNPTPDPVPPIPPNPDPFPSLLYPNPLRGPIPQLKPKPRSDFAGYAETGLKNHSELYLSVMSEGVDQ